MNDQDLMRTFLARRDARKNALDEALFCFEIELTLAMPDRFDGLRRDDRGRFDPLQTLWDRAVQHAGWDVHAGRCEPCALPELVPALVVEPYVLGKRRRVVAAALERERARVYGKPHQVADLGSEHGLLVVDPSEARPGRRVYELRQVGEHLKAIDVTPQHPAAEPVNVYAVGASGPRRPWGTQ